MPATYVQLVTYDDDAAVSTIGVGNRVHAAQCIPSQEEQLKEQEQQRLEQEHQEQERQKQHTQWQQQQNRSSFSGLSSGHSQSSSMIVPKQVEHTLTRSLY